MLGSYSRYDLEKVVSPAAEYYCRSHHLLFSSSPISSLSILIYILGDDVEMMRFTGSNPGCSFHLMVFYA